jgi:hypothetical protein
MKQTAVEWLVNELFGTIIIGNEALKKIEQAKEIEKEQITGAFIEGNLSDLGCDSEQYYNETFKSE